MNDHAPTFRCWLQIASFHQYACNDEVFKHLPNERFRDEIALLRDVPGVIGKRAVVNDQAEEIAVIAELHIDPEYVRQFPLIPADELDNSIGAYEGSETEHCSDSSGND